MNRRRAAIIASAAFTLVSSAEFRASNAEEVSPNSVIIHPLRVVRHPSAQLTEQDLSNVLRLGSEVLSQCRASFSATGPVQVAGVPSVINSSADMQAACGTGFVAGEQGYEILGVPRAVKIVNAINWCGSTAAGIIGCAYTPGSCMVVRRFAVGLEGILWAHEFGHSKGLPHRQDSTTAVMYPSIGSDRRVFNSSECGRIRQYNFYGDNLIAQAQVKTAVSIEEFVSAFYPGGVNYDDARKFSVDDVKKIIPWLSDVAKEANWVVILSVVGIVAGQDAFDQLTNFISRPGTGKLSIGDYDARVSAIVSLGYVFKGNNDQRAIDFLQRSTNASSWSSTTWTAPYHQSSSERDIDLANAAVLGLSLTNANAALEHLEDLARVRPLDFSTRNAVEQAVKELRRAK